MSNSISIIWDWNGTLLNDVDICVESINVLLSKRKLASLTKEKYQRIFTFPVIEYYKEAGFEFAYEPFDKVAMEFIDEYKSRIPGCGLFSAARKVLSTIAETGYKQYMISAMEHEFLLDTVESEGIIDYFEAVSGVKDHYASGKTNMAREFIKTHGINPESAWFIGDTLHDYEVATELGMNCLLVSNGHQSFERLALSGCKTVHDITNVYDCLKNNCFENKS